MRTIPLMLALIITIFLPDDLSAQVVQRDTIPQYAPLVITDPSISAQKSDAALPVSDAVLLQLQVATVATILGQKPHAMRIQMPMDDGTIRRLDLKRFELLAPGAHIMRGTDLGDEEISMAFASYTGTVEGIPVFLGKHELYPQGRPWNDRAGQRDLRRGTPT